MTKDVIDHLFGRLDTIIAILKNGSTVSVATAPPIGQKDDLVDYLEETLAARVAEKESLLKQLKDAQDKIDELELELETCKNDRADLEGELKDLERELERKEYEIADLHYPSEGK